MKQRIFIAMIVIFSAGIGIVYILFVLAEKGRPLNGFTRNLLDLKAMVAMDTLNVEFNSYYVAGKTKHNLYLGNIVAPRHLLIVNASTFDTQRVALNLDNKNALKFWSLKVHVDSPSFYMVDGAVPAIFRGDLETKSASIVSDRGAYFLQWVPVAEGRFVIRSLSGKQEARLGKMSYRPLRAVFPPGLLERQVDGIFCTEGMLHYDKVRARVVFVYFYRNEYLVMDSALNLLYKANTIDTIKHAKIEVTTVGSSGVKTFASPPLVVNRQSALSGGWLFVNSGLQADNETHSQFRSSSVIDVYNVDSGRYKFSLYVPDHTRKLRHFEIIRDRLIVMYEQHVLSYDLRPYFSDIDGFE